MLFRLFTILLVATLMGCGNEEQQNCINAGRYWVNDGIILVSTGKSMITVPKYKCANTPTK